MNLPDVLEETRNEQDGKNNDSHLMNISQDRAIDSSLANVSAPDLQNKICNAANENDNLRENTGEVVGDDQFSLEYAAYLQQLKNHP